MILQRMLPVNVSDRCQLLNRARSRVNTKNSRLHKDNKVDRSQSPFLGSSRATALMEVCLGALTLKIAMQDFGSVLNFILHKAASNIGHTLRPLPSADAELTTTMQSKIITTHYVEIEIKSHRYNMEWHRVKFMVVDSSLGVDSVLILSRNYITDHKISESVIKRQQH
jgi:hypothetical protein